MARKEQFAENEFYHLYNRGVDKRDIFLKREDYDRFMRLLYVCNGESEIRMEVLRTLSFSELLKMFSRRKPLVAIGAYCLMPNHFHILIRQIQPNGISRFMQKLMTAYSMYFNTKYERSGTLFEGRFKSKRAIHDNYLRYLFAYIHLNPVKLVDSTWKEKGIQNLQEARTQLLHYDYSSYLDFIGKVRPEGAIVSNAKEFFPEYFEDFAEFDEFINAWLTYSKEILELEGEEGRVDMQADARIEIVEDVKDAEGAEDIESTQSQQQTQEQEQEQRVTVV
ncbi:hypothetical protein CL630_01455 [bacterium]|nr:hypothetical protein [bacterium]|tara:strand:+ start:18433 stop:19269 length:837 start_codon:yes stop_codon:yes gene_type:complete